MNNKKILIITAFCAPETHAAVFRAHKLAKYLKRDGWEPSILTVDKNYVYNEDSRLLDDLNGIKIYRAKYIEPSIRGLKMWLGGADRTYKTLKHTYVAKTGSAEQPEKKRFGLKNLYSFFVNHLLNVPDRYWTWEKNAITLGKKVIRDNDISFIYTTCLPLTTNKIGIGLKKACNVKWVADFRDPITYSPRMHSKVDYVFKLQKRIEKNTFETADKIVHLSSAHILIYNDLYAGKYDAKTEFIPTGVDDDIIPDESRYEQYSNTIIFIGEYLVEYGDDFFQKFRASIDSGSISTETRVLIIGDININQNILNVIIVRHSLSEYVSFLDHKPQRELYKIIVSAKAVLLIPGYYAHWWNNFAKLVDYIALQIPVIAMVPDPSEARKELGKAALGIFLDKNDDLGEKLKEVDKSKNDINKIYCKKYLASSQAHSFIKIFETLA